MPWVPPRAVQKPMGQELQMPTEPPPVGQMLWVLPLEPQVPVQKATMPVVQKVPGPGFQLQNQNTNSIIDNLSSVVNHFIVIKSVAGAPKGVAGACPNMSN
eukprot:scaffold6187_cov139-Skeletonema_menzelii.AAC.2